MGEQFGRVARATVGDVVMEGFRIQFRVEKTSDAAPNTIDFSISNLAAATRERLQQANVPVIFEAGYLDQTEVLFKGDCRYISSSHQETDWVTRVQSGDGENAFAGSRVNESFAANTDVRDVAKKAMEAMKLEMRDAAIAVKNGDWKGAQEKLWHGCTASGKAANILSDVLGSGGMSWSIQDGVLQVLSRGKTTGDKAIVLGPTTGLIGSPELGEKGYVKLRSLLNGGLKPGRRLVLNSAAFQGAFRIEKVLHVGDTHGAEWYSDVEAFPL